MNSISFKSSSDFEKQTCFDNLSPEEPKFSINLVQLPFGQNCLTSIGSFIFESVHFSWWLQETLGKVVNDFWYDASVANQDKNKLATIFLIELMLGTFLFPEHNSLFPFVQN